jgi:hypothetical protein
LICPGVPSGSAAAATSRSAASKGVIYTVFRPFAALSSRRIPIAGHLGTGERIHRRFAQDFI